MALFNSKEEVINIELTSYGKFLLSRGKLKPAYYSFHDEGIIYDSEYADFQENSNISENRIQQETPHLKPNYSFFSPKASINKDIVQLELLNNKFELASTFWRDSPSSLYWDVWSLKLVTIDSHG